MTKDLYRKLKAITDRYVWMLHQLKGYHIDSLQGFKAYLKEFTASQAVSSRQLNIPISQIDKASLIYAAGAPTDQNATITHECTQGELKDRLRKGGLNETLVGQFCIVMAYEYWEQIRGDIADALQTKRGDIKSDIFGDIRHFRHDIVHNIGTATKAHSEKAVILNWFKDGTPIIIDNENLDTIIGEIINYFNQLIQNNTGEIPYADNSLSLAGKAKQMKYIKAGKMKIKK